MDIEKFWKTLGKIEMPQETQERIIKNCNTKNLFNMEEYAIRKYKKFWSKRLIPLVSALSVFLCFAIVGTAAVKTGFFKDAIRWDGAVVGTTYEQASEEIEVTAIVDEKELVVLATMLSPDKPPYSILEEFGISSYQIIDMSGNMVIQDAGTQLSRISNGQAEIEISLDGIESGNYKLIINKYVGSAKADQPLEISGVWECEFEIYD